MNNQENNSFVRDELPEEVEIIGISFRGATKIYYFAANGCVAKEGDNAIVETARGLEYGKVTLTNSKVKRGELVLPLKNVIRIADKNDDMRYEANRDKEKEAFDVCAKKILDHRLDMKLIDVEYTFDNSKLLFYFTSDDRVDFRELVKDLAGYFRTRIELRQIGIRDEAKIMGGLGICGRPFCCNTFLPDFVQVSIKMAKEQNLSLNSAKISGACGRLMCCLRYEYDTYQEELRHMPKLDSTVMTPDGAGVVTELKPLLSTVKVRLANENEKQPKIYPVSALKPYDKNAPVEVPAKSDTTSQDKKDASASSDKNKGRNNERHPAEEERNKKNDDVRREKPIQNQKSLTETDKPSEEAVVEKREKEGKKGGKRNRHNRNRKEQAQTAVAPAVAADKAKPDGKETGEHSKNEHNKNRHAQNRHQNKKHGGEKREAQPAAENKDKQNHPRKPQNESAPAVQAKKAEPASASGENEGRKSFAPMPSNSIKKSNRNRFGNIKTKSGNAFSSSQSQEKKDNSEKK